jgi:hypothetical protein
VVRVQLFVAWGRLTLNTPKEVAWTPAVHGIKNRLLAEREGFEPSRRFPAYTRSRRAPSTTRPPLRHIRSAAPATLDNIGKSVSETVHPVLWDPLLTGVLALPAWMLLLILAWGIGYASRERRQINIFIN